MQRLGGAKLPRVPVLPVRPSFNIQVRFKHEVHWPFKKRNGPLRSNYKAFEASNLVLDLDAEDNPYVRPYNDDVDGVPAQSSLQRARELRPIQKRVAQFERLSQEYDEYSRLTASDKFSPWRISDHDILSIALGNSTQSERVQHLSTNSDPNNYSDELANDVLKWNGIPLHVRNSSSKTIAYMRRRQQLSHRLQPIVGDEKSLNDALRACSNFSIFERLVTNVVQTLEGCQLVSNCSERVGLKCNKFTEAPPAKVLSFLNNLILRLDSQGLRISASIFWCAYLNSLRCGVFSVSQKYLKRLQGQNHELRGPLIAYTLEALEKSITPHNPGDIRTHPGADTVHQLLSVYSLLTGRVLGEITPQPPLDDIVLKRGNPDIFTYLTCLARLGAFRTMWHIWHREYKYFARDFLLTHGASTSASNLADMAEKLDDTVEASGRGAISEDSKALTFAHAIQEAMRTNNRFVELTETPDFARATGQYDGDCQLDMETIIYSADVISTRGDGQSRQAEGEEMNEIFNKNTIKESLLALQAYLRRVPMAESG
ncbi:Pre-mRNA-splicing factor SYF2 [Hypoxylon texense]